MLQIKTWFRDFSHLFFPFNCLGCDVALSEKEETLCFNCMHDLPLTHYWRYDDNTVAAMFYGKLPFDRACSFLYFTKGGRVQQMMHHLKYASRPEVGELLGKLFGIELLDSNYQDIDLIIPVPIHPKRLKTRGYNQCDHIGMGISKSLHKPCCTESVVRTVANESQTRKGRFDRWKNVSELFKVLKPENLQGKHILLVDDVVTTGSTLESCAKVLLKVQGVRISIATIASPNII